jgi:peptidoglycan/LPS O-acetylase OafA/YrhL
VFRAEIRIDIQILRALSVIMVVGYHLRIPGFQNGFLGVDIFFIISGYLMAQTYKKSKPSEFYLRRARRLLPAYFFTIFITVIISAIVTVSSDFNQVLEQAKSATLIIPNFFFWSQDSYFSSRNFNPLLNLWSLGIEIQFYLFVPFINWLSKKRYALGTLCLFTFASCLAVLTISPKTAFFLTPFRFWEFLAGYIVFEGFKKVKNRKVTHPGIQLISFLLVLLILLLPIDSMSTSILRGQPGLPAAILTLLVSFILLSNIQIPINSATKLFSLVGEYSYSIYLVHFPLLILLTYKPFNGNGFANLSLNSSLLYLSLLFLLSLIVFNLVEKRYRKSKLGYKTFVAILILIFASLPVSNSIKISTYSEIEKKVSNAYFDRLGYRCGKIFRIIHPMSPICKLTSKASGKNVLLLGNSHADSIKTVFTEAANDADKVTYFWVQNDPLNGGRQSIDFIVESIVKHRIQSVFLHYSTGAVKKEILSEFISKLKLEDIEVVILGPVPTWPESVPESMWLYPEAPFATQTYLDFLSKNERGVKELMNFSKNTSLEYVDLAKPFCLDACQYASQSGIPYYWDEGHLTLSGAKVLRYTLSQALSR